MVKFYDINAGAGDKPSEETTDKEAKVDKKVADAETDKPSSENAKTTSPDVKDKKDAAEPLRPDFSVATAKEEAAAKTVDDTKEPAPEPAAKTSDAAAETEEDVHEDTMPKAPDIPRATASMAPKSPEQHSAVSQSTYSATGGQKKHKIVTAILSILLIILLALLVSQAVIYFTQTAKEPSTASTPKQEPVVKTKADASTTTDTTKTTETPDTTKTTDTTTTTTTTTTTDLTKDKATVRILNGSGVSGAAAKVSSTLKAAGFTVSSTGNAKSFTYATTEVLYKADTAKAVAEEVAKTLSSYTTEVKKDDSIPASDTEIVVIIGKK